MPITPKNPELLELQTLSNDRNNAPHAEENAGPIPHQQDAKTESSALKQPELKIPREEELKVKRQLSESADQEAAWEIIKKEVTGRFMAKRDANSLAKKAFDELPSFLQAFIKQEIQGNHREVGNLYHGQSLNDKQETIYAFLGGFPSRKAYQDKIRQHLPDPVISDAQTLEATWQIQVRAIETFNSIPPRRANQLVRDINVLPETKRNIMTMEKVTDIAALPFSQLSTFFQRFIAHQVQANPGETTENSYNNKEPDDKVAIIYAYLGGFGSIDIYKNAIRQYCLDNPVFSDEQRLTAKTDTEKLALRIFNSRVHSTVTTEIDLDIYFNKHPEKAKQLTRCLDVEYCQYKEDIKHEKAQQNFFPAALDAIFVDKDRSNREIAFNGILNQFKKNPNSNTYSALKGFIAKHLPSDPKKTPPRLVTMVKGILDPFHQRMFEAIQQEQHHSRTLLYLSCQDICMQANERQNQMTVAPAAADSEPVRADEKQRGASEAVLSFEELPSDIQNRLSRIIHAKYTALSDLPAGQIWVTLDEKQKNVCMAMLYAVYAEDNLYEKREEQPRGRDTLPTLSAPGTPGLFGGERQTANGSTADSYSTQAPPERKS